MILKKAICLKKNNFKMWGKEGMILKKAIWLKRKDFNKVLSKEC